MKNLFVFLFVCCVQAVSAHIAFFCATYANVPSVTNIENIEKTSIYGTFGTEMPHGALAQVAQTSYMKGEFLYQLFIIMSINLQGGDSLLSRLEIFRSE